MKKLFLTIILVMVIGTGIFFAVRKNDTKDASKIQATASFYPLYEFTKAVGGQYAQVSSMIPAGAEPHDYEPSAKELAEAHRSQVFVYVGGTFEPWANKFAAEFSGKKVVASDVIELEHLDHQESETETHEHGDTDPHFWLDPVLAQQVVTAIADKMSEVDPEHAQEYKQNAVAYNQKLAALDQTYQTGLKNCQERTIIATHDAYNYLAHRYNFSVMPITGISPEDEPSAGRMAEIADIVRQQNISYIFFESLVSSQLADTMSQETGAKTLVLDPIEGVRREDQQAGKNYITIQEQNLKNLQLAMACN